MTLTELWLIPIGVVLGLAITDIVESLHRLLASREPLEWHWIPLMWGALVIVATVVIWLGYFNIVGAMEEEGSLSGFRLLRGMVSPTILYLIASASLPDDASDAGGSLRDFFLRRHRYLAKLWIVFLLWTVVYLALIDVSTLRVLGLPFAAAVLFTTPAVFSRAVWYHTLICVLGLGVAVAALTVFSV